MVGSWKNNYQCVKSSMFCHWNILFLSHKRNVSRNSHFQILFFTQWTFTMDDFNKKNYPFSLFSHPVESSFIWMLKEGTYLSQSRTRKNFFLGIIKEQITVSICYIFFNFTISLSQPVWYNKFASLFSKVW